MSELRERMDRWLVEKEKREHISCPHCGTRQQNDDNQYPVSYWGEDPPETFTCQNENCEKEFFVKERVDREYSVGKTEAEASKL